MNNLFCKHLEETCNKIKTPFSTLKWLSYLDDDSIKMLMEYFDNFNINAIPENINDNEVEDIIKLVSNLIKKEVGVIDYEFCNIKDLVSGFFAFVFMTDLSKKGLIDFVGSGMLANIEGTNFFLTEKGVKEGLNSIRKDNFKVVLHG